MNFLKKKFKGVSGKKPGGSGQRLDSEGTASTKHTPSEAKDAAKLAAERRFALEQEKQAQADVRRRERQMKLEEDRLLQQQFREMSISEQEEYQQKMKEKEGTNNEEPVKKKFNPVLYTSPMVGEGLVAGPANELFQQLADVIKSSDDVDEEKKREYAARLFHTANNSNAQEKALTRIRKIIQMICENPDEMKYREVKRQHPLYADTVTAAIGAELYLLLIGFEIAEVFEKGSVIRLVDGTDLDLLPIHLEYLESTTCPLELDVYRHAKVYFLAENVKIEPIRAPDWTYKLSAAEIAALQKEREREVEWWMTVCSKRPKSVPTPFKVSIIRIRFPNSAVLEALFGIHESINDVFSFVGNLLGYPSESFILSESIGNKFDINSTETIGELKLVPSAVLHFKFIDQNYPFPTQNHVKQCQEARQKMNFAGIDITDYKF